MEEKGKRSQSEQDYLESILLLSKEQGFVHRVEVANRMNVSQAAVNKAMKLLQAKGYLYEDGKHLYLTEKGEAYAKEIFEKHCILREFFLSLGVPQNVAEQDACNFEHAVSDETFAALKKWLKK